MIFYAQEYCIGPSLVIQRLRIQRLRLHASNAGGVGSIPGWETKIPHAMQ